MFGVLPIHEAGPCNNSDKLRTRCDCERKTTGNQENDIVTDPLDAERTRCRDSNLQPSNINSNTLTIMLQKPCLQGVLPSCDSFEDTEQLLRA